MLTCSPAPGRPWLNSGIETPANACQMFVPEPNHLENSVLCVPYCPVIVKVGNQAACATPIRAVAPRRVASALRTSGRLPSSAEGTPAGAGMLAALSLRAPAPRVAAGVLANSPLPAVFWLGNRRFPAAAIAAGSAAFA